MSDLVRIGSELRASELLDLLRSQGLDEALLWLVLDLGLGHTECTSRRKYGCSSVCSKW